MTKIKIETVIEIAPTILLACKNDKRSQNEDKDKVRDNKTTKKDIVCNHWWFHDKIYEWYMNGLEIPQSSLVKIWKWCEWQNWNCFVKAHPMTSSRSLEDDINQHNKKLENLCKGKGMHFIDNGNMKSSSLNRSKLHFNKSETALLTKNFAKIVNSDWLYWNIDGQVINLTKDSSFIASNVSHLGNLRSKNPKNIIFSYININSIRS